MLAVTGIDALQLVSDYGDFGALLCKARFMNLRASHRGQVVEKYGLTLYLTADAAATSKDIRPRYPVGGEDCCQMDRRVRLAAVTGGQR